MMVITGDFYGFLHKPFLWGDLVLATGMTRATAESGIEIAQ